MGDDVALVAQGEEEDLVEEDANGELLSEEDPAIEPADGDGEAVVVAQGDDVEEAGPEGIEEAGPVRRARSGTPS